MNAPMTANATGHNTFVAAMTSIARWRVHRGMVGCGFRRLGNAAIRTLLGLLGPTGQLRLASSSSASSCPPVESKGRYTPWRSTRERSPVSAGWRNILPPGFLMSCRRSRRGSRPACGGHWSLPRSGEPRSPERRAMVDSGRRCLACMACMWDVPRVAPQRMHTRWSGRKVAPQLQQRSACGGTILLDFPIPHLPAGFAPSRARHLGPQFAGRRLPHSTHRVRAADNLHSTIMPAVRKDNSPCI